MAYTNITLLVPIYNSERYISRLVNNINMLDYPNLYTIFVNDGSCDRSSSLLEEGMPNATIISQANTGIVGALNTGFHYSTTEWVARGDDDDTSSSDRLKVESELITPNTVLVCGAYERVREDGSLIEIRRPPLTDQQIKLALYFDNPIAHGSVLIKKSAVDAVGGYRDKCPSEDYDLWIRLATKGLFHATHHTIYSHMENPDGISQKRHAEQLLLSRDIRNEFWRTNTPSVWNKNKINSEALKIQNVNLEDELTAFYRDQFIVDLARLTSKFIHYRMFREAVYQALFIISIFPVSGSKALLHSLFLGLKH